MLKLVSAAAIVGLATHLAAAPAFAAGSCQVAMTKLMDEWQAVGYQMPQATSAKDDVVGKVRVVGNDGHVASGQQVIYMRSQISLAGDECAQGSDAAALTRIANVNAMLDNQTYRTAGAASH